MSSTKLIVTMSRAATLTFALMVAAGLLPVSWSTPDAAAGCPDQAAVGGRTDETAVCAGKDTTGSAKRPAAAPQVSEGEPAAAPASATAQTAPGGMRVYVDPQTGEFATAPGPQAGDPEPNEIPRSGSAGSAQLWDSPVPGGGQMIDTHGQFLHTMQVEAGPAGMVVKCKDDEAAPQAGTER